MRYKLILLFGILLIFSDVVTAQKGPFLRFSLGPGVMNEYSSIKGAGFNMAAKNHAIGWGFNDKYALYYSEFGAFVRKDIGNVYQYINLDAYGLGLAYSLSCHISVHVSGAYGTIHFSDSWKKQGDFIEDGNALAFGADKKWLLSKRIDLGVGPLLSFFKASGYIFINFKQHFGFLLIVK